MSPPAFFCDIETFCSLGTGVMLDLPRWPTLEPIARKKLWYIESIIIMIQELIMYRKTCIFVVFALLGIHPLIPRINMHNVVLIHENNNNKIRLRVTFCCAKQKSRDICGYFFIILNFHCFLGCHLKY